MCLCEGVYAFVCVSFVRKRKQINWCFFSIFDEETASVRFDRLHASIIERFPLLFQVYLLFLLTLIISRYFCFVFYIFFCYLIFYLIFLLFFCHFFSYQNKTHNFLQYFSAFSKLISNYSINRIFRIENNEKATRKLIIFTLFHRSLDLIWFASQSAATHFDGIRIIACSNIFRHF